MDGCCEDGTTDLMRACMENDPQLAELCLMHGDDIDAIDEIGRTALMWSVVYGSRECLAFLLQRGADRSLRDYEGNGLLDLARINNNDMLLLEVLMSLQTLESCPAHENDG